MAASKLRRVRVLRGIGLDVVGQIKEPLQLLHSKIKRIH